MRELAAVKPFEPAKPGTVLAGFNVLAWVGQGAASQIYVVQDPKTKQIYALKHVEKNDPKDIRFIEQAEREYEIGSKVKHPAVRSIMKIMKTRERIVSVKEVFLLMEYVDGVSIEKAPPRTFERAVDIFLQVADGLAAMHKAGWVHADMKPNNVVVNEAGQVKIIDLGQGCPTCTVKERIQGTPDYIAPEQVHRRAITAKTDIYNLGATMYWVFTGKNIPTAMPKDNSLVSSLDDAFIEKPRPVRELNSRCPDLLSDMIMACVQVDPDARPADMDEVYQRLDLVRAKLATAANPQTAPSLDDTAI
ncbi:MAG: serine/threonine-protein kinase [Planctomycetota bacterium]|nr:serine/threonine-protein kinase [Planctomycetota bacterium]